MSDEKNLEDKEPEEGECSESENDGISDEIIPDVSTNSESDDEEQGLLFIHSQCFLNFVLYVTVIITLHMYFSIWCRYFKLKINNTNFNKFSYDFVITICLGYKFFLYY